MRIAFIGFRSIGNCSGGIENHVEQLAVRMAKLGHEVTVFCRKRYNELACSTFKGLTLCGVPAIYTKHLEAISHTALSIPRALRGFDVIHIHALGPSLLSWIPRLFGRKVVVTVHGLDFLRAKWSGAASLVLRGGEWTAVNCPQKTIVVSKALREHFRVKRNKNTIYIPNGVTPPSIRPADRIKRYGLHEKDYILFLGRLVPEKGVHHLIRAFRDLSTDLKLAIVGDACHTDSYEEKLRDLADGDGRITFTGPLYGQDKDEVFSNAKLFILPSELEGMPIVLLEAMSFACPILSSNIPECTEVFESERGTIGCTTFESGNVESLREELRFMFESASLDLEDMGQKAREFVLANYDWDSITEKTLKVYESALN